MSLTMKPGHVRSIGNKSRAVAAPLQWARSHLADGWTPDSDPEFKTALLSCRKAWTSTLGDLRRASETIGDKMHATANAVRSGDDDSADQF